MSERLTQLLISWRWPLLGIALIAAATAYLPSQDVTFDRSVENLFADDDPLLTPYHQLKRTFGGNEVVMVAYLDPDLLAQDMSGIRRLTKLAEQCEAVPGVRAVLSLDRPIGEDIVDRDNPLATRTRAAFENYTHGADGQTAAIVAILNSVDEATVARQQTIDDLRGIVEHLPDGLAGGFVTGEPAMVSDGFRYIEDDGRRLGTWSTVLLAGVILILFRSLRWVLIPLVVVQLTLVLTRATLVWSGSQLSMVSSMLTAIVTVIGVATVIHVIVRFREARSSGLKQREALVRAGTLLMWPIFWAIATDAVGFASLLAAKVGPVRDFGLMMIIGSLFVLVSVVLTVPGLALLGNLDTEPRVGRGERWIRSRLSRLITTIQQRRRMILCAIMVVSILAIAGVLRMEVETDFTKNFRSDSPIVRSYDFVEDKLGGAGVLDVILPAPKQLSPSYLRGIQRLEERLRKEVVVRNEQGEQIAGLTKAISLADMASASGLSQSMSLRLMKFRMPDFYSALYGVDPITGHWCFRIMLRAQERQPANEKQKLIDQVTRIAREELPATETRPAVEVTGFFVLLTNLIKSMVRDQWLTFAIACMGIWFMTTLAVRNPIYALVALVPNAIPIVLVLGTMGWLGVRMNMGAAMIAAVSMGLSIDSSIHYITSFRRALQEGNGVTEALRSVQQTVGMAVVFSTLALIIGFSILATSQFVPTIYFGVLVSFSMLGGLLGNLILLPLLLAATTSKRADPTP
ncbi:MAG: MMPL family transporter [Pirellulaceae bacterium]|nr:MMPL family transporter [Pirellulaceae bacterium]MDP6555509.1 MMPL family transporter [Pirellulaceae bacterium]